jgi:hypothetical protein
MLVFSTDRIVDQTKRFIARSLNNNRSIDSYARRVHRVLVVSLMTRPARRSSVKELYACSYEPHFALRAPFTFDIKGAMLRLQQILQSGLGELIYRLKGDSRPWVEARLRPDINRIPLLGSGTSIYCHNMMRGKEQSDNAEGIPWMPGIFRTSASITSRNSPEYSSSRTRPGILRTSASVSTRLSPLISTS